MPEICRSIKKIEYEYSIEPAGECCEEFKTAWKRNYIIIQDQFTKIVLKVKYTTDHRDPYGPREIQESIKIHYCPWCGDQITIGN